MPAARIQPQGRVRVNRSNPLTRALQFAWSGATPLLDAKSGKAGSQTSGVAQVISPSGIGQRNNGVGSSGISFADGAWRSSLTGAITILAIVRPNVSNEMTVLGQTASNGATNSPFDFGTSNNTIRIVRSNTDYRIWLSGSSLAPFSTTRSVLAVATGAEISTPPSFYRNGVKDTVAPVNQYSSTGSGQAGSNTSPLYVFNRQDGTTAYNGDVYLALVWSRTLSDAEIAAISANPWQVFEGQAPMLYAAAAPSVVNGSATPLGVSASSTVGSASVSGQGRVSPAGVSAASAVGTAVASGTTVVNATATPVGVSAASAVGTPAASGAANKAVSGVSSAAAVGTVSASGATVISGTASPAGVSATSAVGVPVATGSAAVAPSGVAASAALGNVSASGATVMHGNASAAGVQAAGTVGSATANGAANAATTGVQAVSAVGAASANGGISVAGNAQSAGVLATASVGTPSASGATVTHGNASATGVAAAASVGTVTVSASARAMPVGVSVLATIGQPIAAGQIQVSGNALPSGVIAYAYVGTVTAGSVTFARAPAGPGYSRPFTNTTRPHQVNTRRK